MRLRKLSSDAPTKVRYSERLMAISSGKAFTSWCSAFSAWLTETPLAALARTIASRWVGTFGSIVASETT